MTTPTKSVIIHLPMREYAFDNIMMDFLDSNLNAASRTENHAYIHAKYHEVTRINELLNNTDENESYIIDIVTLILGDIIININKIQN